MDVSGDRPVNSILMYVYITSKMVLTYDNDDEYVSSFYSSFLAPSLSFTPYSLPSSLLFFHTLLPFIFSPSSSIPPSPFLLPPPPSPPSSLDNGVELQSSLHWLPLMEHHRMLIQRARAERQLPVVGRSLQVCGACMWVEPTPPVNVINEFACVLEHYL